ncbi:hypothetical protein JJB09_09935 [Rhizobium sp. KVB221]|uniref:Uncharacterized protein n=1 Tax=Rhizobium setariae TaxID=2801340 RepID=A0A936YMQ7_9HYPH|nr:hypothetical protein [Rhizobium setariae]MBL0372348.1 hypothetical protein [Rhizobium setariae]
MADFIAVIRRAVDGLSDNTPEMRAKVYERARSAVVRQLENMKPRPPEVMFQKQLDKLDAAIRQVEEEHAEALPSEAPVGQAEAPAYADSKEIESAPAQPAADADVVQSAQPVAQPIEPETETQEAVHPEQDHQQLGSHAHEETVRTPDEHHTEQVAEPAATDYPSDGTHSTNYAQNDDEVALAPHAEPEQATPDDGPGAETAEQAPAATDFGQPNNAEHLAHPDNIEEYLPEIDGEQTAAAARNDDAVSAAVEQSPAWPVELDQEPEATPEVIDEPTASMPKASYDETDVVSGFNDFVQQDFNRTAVPPLQQKAEKRDDFSWDAPFDDLPDIPKPASFEKALEAKQKEIETSGASARAELEDLIGFDRTTAEAAGSSSTTAAELPPEVTRAVNKLEGKSFRMHNKKKKNRQGGVKPLFLALGVAGALVVASGAYALWHFRDDVSRLAADIFPAGEPAKPVSNDKAATDAKEKAAIDAKPADANKQAEVAAVDGAGPQKFTQRLNIDGTETASLAETVAVDQGLKEGKSVAGQTDPGKEVATNDTKPVDNKPTAETPSLGVTQKMFLYEERLGQTSPVAATGTIVWSEKSDTKDGKPDPSIEAKLDIPDRKISALLSIKRNTDPSLPASHIIEIVFALPKDFPEGNIESIQRIAFKQTEQDRGNPLIAVPAKITDDFHMVALNDDAEARSTNLDLMKTRSWIDIPITYRNGRRALITLEKGATGTAIFDKVFSEWNALGPQSVN